MRIFKLARRSVGLQSIAHTVRTSWKDLGLLFMLVGMGMLVFGSLEYFIENEEPDTGFTSIPQVDCTYIQGVSKKMSFLGKIAITTLKLIQNANVGGVLENSGYLLPHGH